MKNKDVMVQAIIKEIELTQDFLEKKNLESIYFGGGTPSLLDEGDLGGIFEALAKVYPWNTNTEITLEANPDDLTASKLNILKASGINRLSIGIQSFDEVDLKYMNRAHTAKEAENCIKQAQDVGFSNLTADLIYGSPTTSNEGWVKNMDRLLSFEIPHISSYALTVEEGTALHHFIAKGKSEPVDDQRASEQFDLLMDKMETRGYEHYEISNFAKQEKYAIHNTNYWLGIPYLGLGPAAHSYDGKSVRSWNIAHNSKYIKSIFDGILPTEQEILSSKEKYNEFILIRLRTKWGINENELNLQFPEFSLDFKTKIETFLIRGEVVCQSGSYVLTKSGKQVADRISVDLFAE